MPNIAPPPESQDLFHTPRPLPPRHHAPSTLRRTPPSSASSFACLPSLSGQHHRRALHINTQSNANWKVPGRDKSGMYAHVPDDTRLSAGRHLYVSCQFPDTTPNLRRTGLSRKRSQTTTKQEKLKTQTDSSSGFGTSKSLTPAQFLQVAGLKTIKPGRGRVHFSTNSTQS